MFKHIGMIALSVSLLFSTGCMAEEQKEIDEKSTITFTDDLGRTVTVCQPKRVAALIGSYADVWYQAGGTVCASAEDAWEDFEFTMPEDAVNLGMTKEPGLEKLLAAQPDFIIASTKTQANMNMLDTLEATGIPTAYFEVSNIEDYLEMLKICTEITGRDDLYEENGLEVQKQMEAVIQESKERLKTEEAPKVLVLVASASSIRAKNSSTGVLGQMLGDLGCINIADSEANLLENLNVEYILKEDPDFIFTVQSGGDTEGTEKALKELFSGPAWSGLTAVKEGNIYHMDKRLYNLKPNARWGEAYEGLERILSGE